LLSGILQNMSSAAARVNPLSRPGRAAALPARAALSTPRRLCLKKMEDLLSIAAGLG
jgi:hypothetical protein